MELTPEMTQAFYKIISVNFIGKSVSDVGKVLLQNLVVSFGEYALAMTPIIVVLSDLAQEITKAEILLEGQTNLLNYRDFGSSVYELMEFLRRTEPLTNLLSSRKKPLDVLIGAENPYEQLGNSSIIISGYKVNGYECGSLGIIGPTRMDYAALVPRVRYFTDLVSRLLSQTLEE
ncbi:Heat-inducible transcription repressor HrcA [bioreactor metagenome]|uniref:Heat-inducible transcription repressor HrcA n=1 Tax=bioreactor metagenome TaxID=1076179 RepID=A0A645D4Z6_9ZZZZ